MCVYLGFDADPSLDIAARIRGPNVGVYLVLLFCISVICLLDWLLNISQDFLCCYAVSITFLSLVSAAMRIMIILHSTHSIQMNFCQTWLHFHILSLCFCKAHRTVAWLLFEVYAEHDEEEILMSGALSDISIQFGEIVFVGGAFFYMQDQYISHIMNETGATVSLRGRGAGICKSTDEEGNDIHICGNSSECHFNSSYFHTFTLCL